MPNNEGMGEVGIGTSTVWHVNSQNPANLVFNNFSTFQLGLQAESRTFTGDSISGSDFDGGLRFLSYAFPIKPGVWSSAFGILPYSSVNYNTFSQGEVTGDNTVQQFTNERGEGGLTQFFWGNGLAITRSIYLGVRINYLFGSIDKESQVTIDGTSINANTITFSDKTSYSDINFLFGASYRYLLGEKKSLNFGMIYSIESTLNGKNTIELSRLSTLGGTLDSQEISTVNTDLTFPQTLGFGISLQKPNTYSIGLDVEMQAWSNASDANNTFQDQSKIALGASWTPDFNNVSSYFKRATYRIGFNYLELPYLVNNQSISDFGINFGTSLPVSGLSSIDLAFKFGQLGTTENGLIRESYYRIVLGATINDRWFIKRRYD
ncbi:MAG: hypothetical protein AAGA66_02440 [Bacteroidota bacterium]